jgi:uncharacterized membrane protein
MNVKGSSSILRAMMVNFFVFFVQMWFTIITINSGPQKKAIIGTISIRINKVINALVVIVAINSISSELLDASIRDTSIVLLKRFFHSRTLPLPTCLYNDQPWSAWKNAG